MSGGTALRFTIGGQGKSAAHMQYISRSSAVLDREDGLLMHNMPGHFSGASDYRELKERLVSYAWAREEDEIARHKSAGASRTHYRCMVSFERNVETEKAKELTKEWLEKSFPQGRACAFVHRDTKHTHVHMWIDARQTDDRKINLKGQHYRTLDEKWNKIYAREMGRDEREHLEKKREHAIDRAARARKEEREAPARAPRPGRKQYRAREERNYGRELIEQERIRGNQRRITRVIAREDSRTESIGSGKQRDNREADKGGREGGEIGEREERLAEVSKAIEDRDRKGRELIESAKRTVSGAGAVRESIERQTGEIGAAKQRVERTEQRGRSASREAEGVDEGAKRLVERVREKDLAKERDRHSCRGR